MMAADGVRSSWRRYLSRIVLLALAIVFLGCEPDEGCMVPGQEGCGNAREANQVAHLSEQNPSYRLVTLDTACTKGGWSYYVNYQYEDLIDKGATEKDKPAVTVKFGTLEHGVLSDSGKEPPHFSNGKWTVSGFGMFPKPKKGEADEPPHCALTVVLQKPLIKLPGKGPTISLPFIGPIIGPAPRNVTIEAHIGYDAPPKQNK